MANPMKNCIGTPNKVGSVHNKYFICLLIRTLLGKAVARHSPINLITELLKNECAEISEIATYNNLTSHSVYKFLTTKASQVGFYELCSLGKK